MLIPKKIIQTWKTDIVPVHFEKYAQGWKDHHQDFEFELWTDDKNEQFIRDNYPDFLSKYLSYAYNIQRVDAIRYFLLYHYGGIYVDLDIECIKNVVPLIEHHSCFFATENPVHNEIYGVDVISSNAFMGCTKGHEVFEKILIDLYSEDIKMAHKNQEVLCSTGPFMIRRVLGRHQFKNYTLLDAKFVSPLNYLDAAFYFGKGPEGYKHELMAAYCIHMHWGSWWKKDREF